MNKPNASISIILALLMIATPLAAMPFVAGETGTPVQAPMFTGGDGSIGDPYWIVNASDLQNMSFDLGAHYKLVNDIDAGITSTWNSGAGLTPIGNQSTAFTGSFDGQNYTISDIFINLPSDNTVSMFGRLGSGSYIGNTTLSNANVTGSITAAILVANNAGKIENCHVSGSLSGHQNVGGLVGWNTGNIEFSTSDSDVSGSEDVGGLVGDNAGGTISYSHASGDVDASSQLAGGLVGNNRGAIIGCFATGNAIGPSIVGGLIGDNDETVTNCYSTGNVIGSTNAGGLIGFDDGGTYDNCFWDNETSDQISSAGEGLGAIEGLNTTDMLNNFTFTNAGWDFTDIWFSVNESTRPFLRMEWNTNVSNSHQLQLMQMNLTANYTLANDIDLSDIVEPSQMWGTSIAGGEGFVPVGNNSDRFFGSLDGQGYDITGLFINRTSTNDVGLFGYLGSGASVSNLNLVNNNISGYGNIGGLVGDNDGTVTDCYATGSVSGHYLVGGLVGGNKGTVENCYAIGSVNGTGWEMGGLMGRNNGMVKDCYATGNVSGNNDVGGLVGCSQAGTVENCYATGSVNGTGNRVGGFVGSNEGSVLNSSATGNVSGAESVGGLMGENEGSVTNSSATGIVNGTGNNIGGLIGYAYGTGTVTNCSSTGNVNGVGYIGGLIGWSDDGLISNSSASGDVSGIDNVGGLVGINYGIVESSHATGIVNGTGDSIGGLVGKNENNGRVYNSSASGDVDGISEIGGLIGLNYDVTTISNCSAMGNVSGNNQVGGLLGENYGGPISNSSATGNVIGATDYIGGLIGYNYNGGQVMYCFATGIVNGTGINIGGFVGVNEDEGSTISYSYSTGDVSGDCWVGGFVGFNELDGTINSSYSTGNIIGTPDQCIGGFVGENSGAINLSYSTGIAYGTDYIGGFAGLNNWIGNISNCYSHGDATGTEDNVGGFVGVNEGGSTGGIITNCYSVGLVTAGYAPDGGFNGTNTGTLIDCFWDVDTSTYDQATNLDANGETTANMMLRDTFTAANWNFTDIWGIHEYNTYPFLKPLGIPELDADLEISIVATPDPCNFGDVLMYTVTLTNNGPDIAVNVIVNVTLPSEVTWLNDSQSIGPPTGLYLEAAIGNMGSGESGGAFINVSVDTYVAEISATARIDNTTKDSNLTNNIDWANTTINRVPIAEDDDYQTNEDTIFVLESLGQWSGIFINDYDPDVDSFTVISHEDSIYGANVTILANGSMTYDPTVSVTLQNLKNGQSLNDTFNYTISDGRGGTANATITIQIDGSDDAPIANNDTFVVDEDSGPYSLDVLANDVADEEGDDFYITHGSGATRGVLTVSADGLMLIYTPYNTNYTGYDVFTYMISDGNVTDTASVNLTITPVNDAPVAMANLFHVDEDSGINTLYVLDGAVDAEGDDLIISAITQPNNGTLTITENGKNLTFEPDANFFGANLFNYTISDGNDTDTMMVRVQVNGVNDEPVITTTALDNGIVGQEYSFNLTATDIDGIFFGWGGITNADWLQIQGTGTLFGTPTAAGTFWVNIAVNDGDGVNTPNIVTKNLTLTVTASGTDTDGDGVPDTTDDFPTDPAASVDTDGDGFPDAWNDGYTADDSTTDLVIDDDPDTPNNLGDDVDDTGANLWLYIIIILVIVGAIVGYLVMRGKGKEPVAEESAAPVEEAPTETPEKIVEPETVE